MTTLSEQLKEIRAEWKAGAERIVARLDKEELEKVHSELVRESNANLHEFQDVLIYIDVIRAEYHRRFGDS
jgi:hypothetical protein